MTPSPQAVTSAPSDKAEAEAEKADKEKAKKEEEKKNLLKKQKDIKTQIKGMIDTDDDGVLQRRFHVKDYIKTALEDEFKESWARCINTAMWSDGTQDAKAVVGLMGLITEDPTTGTVHNIDRAANDWWRNRALLGIGYSPANTTLIQTLNDEIVQLRRYGGRPDYAFCGSDFLGALRRELVAKGEFSQNGFAGTNNIGIGGFVLDGVRFVYDPYLDGVSKAKYSYIIDSRKLKWMPMAGQDGVVHNPERPYNQFVVLKSVTCAVTMLSKHMNCNGVYSIA